MRLRSRSRRSRALIAVVAVGVGLVAAGWTPEPPPPPATVRAAREGSYWAAVKVLGPCSQVSVEQIVEWWNAQPRPTYRASVPIDELVTMFLSEGEAEGVRGDIPFMQSVIETGWFSFGGRVPPEANNFSGLGATDGTTSHATFADARTGVRAQIQHLRAYADATATSCTRRPRHYGGVDTRC